MHLDPLGAQPLVDEKTACNMLRSVVPDWEWLIARIEANGGQLRFPSEVVALIKNLKIDNYPRLYENEASICQILISGLIEADALDELNQELAKASPDRRGEILSDFLQALDSLDSALSFPKTPPEASIAQAAFERLSEDKKRQSGLLPVPWTPT